MEIPEEELKRIVQEGYAARALEGGSCCSSNSCCGENPELLARALGYKEEEVKAIPREANLGLSCGNPLAFALLEAGQVVVDLGCGAGMDCFLAAQKVGPQGRVIGVDMTAEMVFRARSIARNNGYGNVEFRLGEIEYLPLADNSCDVVISNCVINLSPRKAQVFREAFRVLRDGGQLVVSDFVLEKELPPFLKESREAYIGCIAGAVLKEEYLRFIEEAGFQEVKIVQETPFLVRGGNEEEIAYLLSATFWAQKGNR